MMFINQLQYIRSWSLYNFSIVHLFRRMRWKCLRRLLNRLQVWHPALKETCQSPPHRCPGTAKMLRQHQLVRFFFVIVAPVLPFPNCWLFINSLPDIVPATFVSYLKFSTSYQILRSSYTFTLTSLHPAISMLPSGIIWFSGDYLLSVYLTLFWSTRLYSCFLLLRVELTIHDTLFSTFLYCFICYQVLNQSCSVMGVQTLMVKHTRARRRKRTRNTRSTRNTNMNIRTSLINLTSSFKKKTSVQAPPTLQVLLPLAAWEGVSPTAWQATCLFESQLIKKCELIREK